MTPGKYLELCRRCAGMTPADLALRIATVPPVDALTRATLIQAIEADLVPVSLITAHALMQVEELAIDLDELLAAAANVERLPLRIVGTPTPGERP